MASRSWQDAWRGLPRWMRFMTGILGSSLVLVAFWQTVLIPMRWPELGTVAGYFFDSVNSYDMWLAAGATAARACIAMFTGFSLALVLAILTGRTAWGWIAFFVVMMMLQKIPGIAMVHVLVSSTLGIGFSMTVVLAATVVLSYTWLVLHHRAETLDPRDVFALRVAGFRGWRLAVYGLLPHLGSTIGSAARLGMSIALVMVVLGEWQGVWADGSIWQYGLGVHISRSYDSFHSQARVLSACAWLGVVGVVLDMLVQAVLLGARRLAGVDLSR